MKVGADGTMEGVQIGHRRQFGSQTPRINPLIHTYQKATRKHAENKLDPAADWPELAEMPLFCNTHTMRELPAGPECARGDPAKDWRKAGAERGCICQSSLDGRQSCCGSLW